MKHLNLILLLLTLSFLVSCEKKDVPSFEPINQLPVASTSGMNTIGCLVNGKALLPKANGWMSNPYNCYYQYLNNSMSEGYHFNVSVINSKDNPVTGVYVQTNNVEFEEGETYPLTSKGDDGKAYGFVWTDDGTKSTYYYTNETNVGVLTITRLDRYEQIVSGTFWFDAVNERGEKVEVRAGRFDMKYVK